METIVGSVRVETASGVDVVEIVRHDTPSEQLIDRFRQMQGEADVSARPADNHPIGATAVERVDVVSALLQLQMATLIGARSSLNQGPGQLVGGAVLVTEFRQSWYPVLPRNLRRALDEFAVRQPLLYPVVVSPPYQGKGVGRALTEAAMSIVAGLNRGPLLTYARSDNLGLQQFLQRLGARGVELKSCPADSACFALSC